MTPIRIHSSTSPGLGIAVGAGMMRSQLMLSGLLFGIGCSHQGDKLAIDSSPAAADDASVDDSNTTPDSSSNSGACPSQGASLPWVYTQLFSCDSPFHTTVARHKQNGATILPSSDMTSLWNQGGVSDQDLSPTSYMFPVYIAANADPTKTISCTGYGHCNADGMSIHVPSGATPEPHSDGHIAIIDQTIGFEFDGYACSVSSTAVNCTWGGKYAIGGNGITNSGSDAVHGGYAAGLMDITAQELLNGHIDHALGLNTKCLNNPTVYPADQNNAGTDSACGGSNPPHYGNLVHLLWTPSQISASPYSAECKTVLTAFATYGAYLYDTGNPGLSLVAQGAQSYTAVGNNNPWETTILPHLKAAGDANGTFWSSCLNHLTAADFEMLQIAAAAY